MRTWRAEEARSRFRDLFDRALDDGPQRVSRHGRTAVIVVSEDEWNRVTKDVPSFGKLLAECPLIEEDLPPRRRRARSAPARSIERTFD